MVVMVVLALCSVGAQAQEKRIYQTDEYGNIQYHKPSYVVEDDGRVIEVDAYGNRQYHKPQRVVEGDTIYKASASGRIRHDKPSYELQDDGQLVKSDPLESPVPTSRNTELRRTRFTRQIPSVEQRSKWRRSRKNRERKRELQAAGSKGARDRFWPSADLEGLHCRSDWQAIKTHEESGLTYGSIDGLSS